MLATCRQQHNAILQSCFLKYSKNVFHKWMLKIFVVYFSWKTLAIVTSYSKYNGMEKKNPFLPILFLKIFIPVKKTKNLSPLCLQSGKILVALYRLIVEPKIYSNFWQNSPLFINSPLWHFPYVMLILRKITKL